MLLHTLQVGNLPICHTHVHPTIPIHYTFNCSLSLVSTSSLTSVGSCSPAVSTETQTTHTTLRTCRHAHVPRPLCSVYCGAERCRAVNSALIPSLATHLLSCNTHLLLQNQPTVLAVLQKTIAFVYKIAAQVTWPKNSHINFFRHLASGRRWRISCSCSENPISNKRSASSKTTYSIIESLKFISMMRWRSRPGVAIILEITNIRRICHCDYWY